MHNGIGRKRLHRLSHCRFIGEIDFKETCPGIHRSTMPHIEVVEDSNFMTRRNQCINSNTSNVSGTAGDQNSHK